MNPVPQPLKEEDYKGDLELLDRYVGFSSELVRMSLLGLAAIGFYLKEFVAPGSAPIEIAAGWFNLLLGFAGLLLAIAVACGLLHRYYATDGLACHLNALRLSGQTNGADKAQKEARNRTEQYMLSHGWLVSCECAVAAGIGILGVAFSIRFGYFGKIQRWEIAVPSAIVFVIVASLIAGKHWWRTLRREPKKENASTPAAA